MNINKLLFKYDDRPADAAKKPEIPVHPVKTVPVWQEKTLGALMDKTPLRVSVSRKHIRLFSVVNNWHRQNEVTWARFSDVSCKVFLDEGTRNLLHDLQPGIYDAKTIDKAIDAEIKRRLAAETIKQGEAA